MEMGSALIFCLLCLTAQLHAGAAETCGGTTDGMEQSGLETVRPKAHMFWLHYKSLQQVSSPGKPWPTILWLQGDLGVSSVGRGNFQEIGPLDVNLKPRDSTWLNKANLLFLDHPVGVGYSYVDDKSALATTSLQAALDMVELLKVLTKEIPTLQSSPLHLVAGPLSSHGGKMAAMIGVEISKAIKTGSLNLKLGGVVFGDGSISPDHFL